jgi:hypothetical protein
MNEHILAKVEEHRQRLQQKAPESVNISLRAALEDLLLKAMEKEVQQ